MEDKHVDNSIVISDNKIENYDELKNEANDILSQIVVTTDESKSKDLTYLFNQNQKKKTLVRTNKQNDLMDALTNEALKRVTTHPEEIDTKQLFDAMKATQELINKGAELIKDPAVDPIAQPIEINGSKTEIHIDTSQVTELDRNARKRVDDLLNTILTGAKSKEPGTILDAEVEEIK